MKLERGRPQLVFDVGGVLAANLDDFWSVIAQAAGVERTELRARYKQQIGTRLWQGSVTEDAFWVWLYEACSSVTTAQAKRELKKVLLPLPALDSLERWSRHADIHILSNHVAAWILPLFAGREPFITSLTISSEVGFEKPDIRIFELAASRLKGSKVCFIDDKITNLEVSQSLGWDTILADIDGNWIREIEHWLQR